MRNFIRFGACCIAYLKPFMTSHKRHGASNHKQPRCSTNHSGKEQIKNKAPHYCPFVIGIYGWPVDSPRPCARVETVSPFICSIQNASCIHILAYNYQKANYVPERFRIVLYCVVLYCIALYCIALHCIALHCIALHCIALHCIVL